MFLGFEFELPDPLKGEGLYNVHALDHWSILWLDWGSRPKICVCHESRRKNRNLEWLLVTSRWSGRDELLGDKDMSNEQKDTRSWLRDRADVLSLAKTEVWPGTAKVCCPRARRGCILDKGAGGKEFLFALSWMDQSYWVVLGVNVDWVMSSHWVSPEHT